MIVTVPEAQKILDTDLPGDFAKVRAALKPFIGGNLSRVVYVTYGNPTLAGPNNVCPGGRAGFDVHPAFNVDADAAQARVRFRGEQVPADGCARLRPATRPAPAAIRPTSA